VTALEDEQPIEVATISNEGTVALSGYLGSNASPMQSLGQVPDEAPCLKVTALQEEVRHGGALNQVLRVTPRPCSRRSRSPSPFTGRTRLRSAAHADCR
jgi:hypothetical protein